MNVKVKTEVYRECSNENCEVLMKDAQVTSIKLKRGAFVGEMDMGDMKEFSEFLQNCLDVYHTVQLEQIDERRSAEGADSLASEVGQEDLGEGRDG